LLPLVEQELKESGLWTDAFGNEKRDWFSKAVDLIRARYFTLKDYSTRGRSYFSDQFDFDPDAVKKNLKKDPKLAEYLPELARRLEILPEFSNAAIEAVFRSFAEEKEIKPGLIINAARTAVSGTSVGPSLFEMLELIGQKKVVERVIKARELVF
jgi:glutamyl-tRNA synthetase